jgi:hypothetical protein
MLKPKSAFQKMFEKFLILINGFQPLMDHDSEESPTVGLCVLPCNGKNGQPAQLVLAHCEFDDDGNICTTTPLAALLPNSVIRNLEPNMDAGMKVTDLFYRKMLEQLQEDGGGWEAFHPDKVSAKTRDPDFDEFVTNIFYPHENN